MKAATPSPRGLGKRSEGDSRACRSRRSTWPITRRRGPSWARAVTRVKERPGFPVTDCVANGRAFQEQRQEERQEVRAEEWSEGDERHGRLSREVAVEHRGSDRDTRRNQRGDPGDFLQRACPPGFSINTPVATPGS